jgi:hypothetical protein
MFSLSEIFNLIINPFRPILQLFSDHLIIIKVFLSMKK